MTGQLPGPQKLAKTGAMEFGPAGHGQTLAHDAQARTNASASESD
jgi:hypothetical protein